MNSAPEKEEHVMQYLSYDQQVKLREEEGISKFIDTAEALTDYATAKGRIYNALVLSMV